MLGQAKVGELVRSKQLDANLEPMLYAKSMAHAHTRPLRARGRIARGREGGREGERETEERGGGRE